MVGHAMIPAFHGELGLRIRYHVPQVHALLATNPQPVEIERGLEALYPRATDYAYSQRPKDDDRHGRPPKLCDREERFVPEPFVTCGVTAKVVICPRGRRYGAAKNWDHWHTLTDIDGVFAAGAPDSSQQVDCPAAWDFNRPHLDASIEAMLSADLVVASDSGLAHLAILCGRPLLLLSHNGKVAPGPVIDSHGRQARKEYWPVRMAEYYHAANHKAAPIYECATAWDEPATVRETIERIIA